MICQMNLIWRLKFLHSNQTTWSYFSVLINLKTILFAHNIYSSRYFLYFVCLFLVKAAVGWYSRNLGCWRPSKKFFQGISLDKIDRWDSTCFTQILQPSIYRLLIFFTLIQIPSMILTVQGCLLSYRKVYDPLSLLFRIGGENKKCDYEYDIWRYLCCGIFNIALTYFIMYKADLYNRLDLHLNLCLDSSSQNQQSNFDRRGKE